MLGGDYPVCAVQLMSERKYGKDMYGVGVAKKALILINSLMVRLAGISDAVVINME